MLLWAPRHPERFRPVSQAAIDAGWRVATRRLTRWPDGDDAVFVVDTLGELMDFYACAQVAFVGGSLQDIGGHNMLEPAAVGTAVRSEEHTSELQSLMRISYAVFCLKKKKSKKQKKHTILVQEPMTTSN